MFVFGEVQEPIPETVNLVEDIVRSQLIELVRLDVADRRLSHLFNGPLGLDCSSTSVSNSARCTLSFGRGSDFSH